MQESDTTILIDEVNPMEESSPQKRECFNTMAKTLTTMEIDEDGADEYRFSSSDSEEAHVEQGSVEVLASFYAHDEENLEITDDSDDYESQFVQDSRLQSLSSN